MIKTRVSLDKNKSCCVAALVFIKTYSCFLSRLTLVFIKTYSCFYQDLLVFLSRPTPLLIKTYYCVYQLSFPRLRSAWRTLYTIIYQYFHGFAGGSTTLPIFQNGLTSNIRIYHGFDHVMWRNAGQIHGANHVFHDKIMCARKQTVL